MPTITYCIIDVDAFQPLLNRSLGVESRHAATLSAFREGVAKPDLTYGRLFTLKALYWLPPRAPIRGGGFMSAGQLATGRDWRAFIATETIEIETDDKLTEVLDNTVANLSQDLCFVAIVDVAQAAEQLQGYDAFIRKLQDRAAKSPAPSTAAHNSSLLTSQTTAAFDAILHGRPRGLRGPPLGVYHPVFPRFVNLCKEPVKPSQDDISAANAIISVSARYFRTEAAFQRAIAEPLQYFLGESSAEKYETRYVKSRSFICDAHRRIPQTDGGLDLIGELKNGIGEEKSDPFEQAAQDYARMSIHEHQSVHEMRLRTCMPSFLLALTGTHLAVGGAVLADRLIIGRLTELVSLVPLDIGNDPDKDRIDVIVRTLRSLRICLDELDLWYDQQSRLPAREPEAYPMPHLVEVPGTDGPIKIQYMCRLKPGDLSGAVFRAKITMPGTAASREAVVKFTRRYSKDAHLAMSAQSYAPELYYAEFEPTVDAFCVIMEYVSEERPPADAASQMYAVATFLHSLNFVHGDMREPNFLFRNGRALLIDYDWAGKLGEASYPCNISDKIHWAPGVGPGQLIGVDHDLFWVHSGRTTAGQVSLV